MRRLGQASPLGAHGEPAWPPGWQAPTPRRRAAGFGPAHVRPPIIGAMNPLPRDAPPLPVRTPARADRATSRRRPHLRPISLGIGEPKHPTPAFIKQALTPALDGLAAYPATAGEPRAARGLRRLAASAATASALDPATQVLPVNGSREALFALAQTVVDAARPERDRWSARIRSIRSTKARRCWPAPQPYYANSDPARNFAADWDSVPDERLGAHAAALRLLARQPDRRRDAAGRMGAAVRAVATATASSSPPTSATREIYFRDEPPLGALEAARAARPRRLPQPGRLHQPVQALQRARACAAASSPATRRCSSSFLLYRTYHGSAMSPAVQQRQHRGLERRGACGRRTARCTAPSSPQVTPLLARGARRAAARRRLLPVGRRAGGTATTSTSPAACSLNTM